MLIPLTILSLIAASDNQLTTGDHTRTIEVDKRHRTYIVHVPPKHDPKKPTPVVTAFHGGGSNAEQMVKFCGLNETADKHGFIVVYPSGTGRLEKLLTFNGGNCCGYAMTNKVDDIAFTRALLDDLAKVVKVDPNRVYATGMSNGAIMSYRLASELSDRIAAIAPVGGPMGTETCNPKRPVPLIHFHGKDDEFAPFKGGKGKGVSGTDFYSVDHSIRAWVKANGCKDEPKTLEIPDKAKDGTKATQTTYSGGKDGAEVVLVAIDGMGHTWPGQQPAVKFLGKSTRNVSANEMMWAFFEKHPMKTNGDAKMVRVLFAEKMVQPQRDVPKEALERAKPDGIRGPFSKLFMGNISSVTVTYFDTKMLKERKDTEEFLRRLLTTPKGSIYAHVPWSQILDLPTVTATVEHHQGKNGTWLIWDAGQSVYCAYKDGSGRWWFGGWFQKEIPR
jgi:polyhydroxybutyrate depolymerase